MSYLSSIRRSFLVLAIACGALLIPAAANAASIVNGDFETGSLSGWQVYNSEPSCGSWFAYTGGTKTPLSGFSFFPPPQGNWAALSDEHCADTTILYQDVTLEPYWNHQLSMDVYYDSKAPIFVPSPNTLSTEGPEEPIILEEEEEFPPINQQMRVDVMKPTAPIESVNPTDILATVFANKNGDSQTMSPTVFNADLTPFGGQTVRLRVAVAAGDFYFNGGVDAVSIASTPPNNAITRGKVVLNKKKGTGKLTINVPGPGTLTAVSKGKKKTIKTVNLTATAAGALKVSLNPTGAGRKTLNNKGKLKAQLAVTFTPTGGLANTQTYKVTLKKTLKPAH